VCHTCHTHSKSVFHSIRCQETQIFVFSVENCDPETENEVDSSMVNLLEDSNLEVAVSGGIFDREQSEFILNQATEVCIEIPLSQKGQYRFILASTPNSISDEPDLNLFI